eukprot:scaffold281993_cov17-Prasinocladus_malaysianus.AAC.1
MPYCSISVQCENNGPALNGLIGMLKCTALIWIQRNDVAIALFPHAGAQEGTRVHRLEGGGLSVDIATRTAWHANYETAVIGRCIPRGFRGCPHVLDGQLYCPTLPQLMGQSIDGMKGHVDGYHPQACQTWSPYVHALGGHAAESLQKP